MNCFHQSIKVGIIQALSYWFSTNVNIKRYGSVDGIGSFGTFEYYPNGKKHKMIYCYNQSEETLYFFTSYSTKSPQYFITSLKNSLVRNSVKIHVLEIENIL